MWIGMKRLPNYERNNIQHKWTKEKQSVSNELDDLIDLKNVIFGLNVMPD